MSESLPEQLIYVESSSLCRMNLMEEEDEEEPIGVEKLSLLIQNSSCRGRLPSYRTSHGSQGSSFR